MNTEETTLLLTLARIWRARMRSVVESDGPLALRDDIDDLAAVEEALKPFDPVPGEPVNEEAST